MTVPRYRLAKLALVAGGLALGIVAGEIFFRLVPFERVKYEARYGHFSGNVVGRFLEYDPQLQKITVIGSLVKIKPYSEFFATVAHFRFQDDPALQPLSNQVRALFGYGSLNRKGFNATAGISYDITNGVLQNQIAQINYNGGCCGIALEYRRINLGAVRTENQFRIAFIIANLGTFGNIRRQEKIF